MSRAPLLTPDDTRFMQRALDLAAATSGLASPNPQVGCVLVRGDTVIGEGAHIYDALDHAEIVALKQAASLGHSAAGATAYVTLEPCSHTGRTGPCADALIAAHIARCVMATVDPNAAVCGRGIAKLRAAGIEVTVGVLEQQARDLNDAFAHYIQSHTSLVTLKAALSVDGKLAPPPALRKPNAPHWLTGLEARQRVQQLRHASDAILTGIGTVLADDPALTDRTGLPRRRPLMRVVLDTNLRLPLDSQLVRTADHDLLILCGMGAAAEKFTALTKMGAEVESVASNEERLNLRDVLALLGRRSLLSVLLECGSHLNGSFIRQGLVDKAVLFYAETELGEEATPFAQGVPSPFLFQQTLHRTTNTSFGSEFCVTGYVTNPWPKS